jgi:hypothetical protein
MKLDELVGKYIELRDKKAEMKAAYDAKIDKLEAALAKIEVILLRTFEETGIESVRTDLGTAYKTTKSSCTVADKDTFMGYVKNEGAWELLDVRASKTAVAQFRSVNDDNPPGLNWREVVAVNVKR